MKNLFFFCTVFLSFFSLCAFCEATSNTNPNITSLEQLEREGVIQRPKNLPQTGAKKGDSAETTVNTVLFRMIDIMLFFAGFLATIALVYSGFLYTTNAYDSGNIEKAKQVFQYAVTGLLIIILSYMMTQNVIRYLYPREIPVPNEQQDEFEVEAISMNGEL